jgi:UDP-glucuronate 4-epimerase
MPMQEGDVPATWADATLLENLTGFKPNTPIKQGVKNFINWYKEYYSI